MKITSSTVDMAASSVMLNYSQKTEQLKVWDTKQPNSQKISDLIDTSSQTLDFTKMMASSDNEVRQSLIGNSDDATVLEISEEDDLKIRLLNKFIELLTGKSIKFYIPRRIVLKKSNAAIYNQPVQSSQALKGWGLDYQMRETTQESASMSFSSTGKVTTSDGKIINFGVELNVSRSFVSEKSISIKAGDALIDPLVVNYGQASAELTSNKFSFDLDNDGKNDSISFVKSGSGFLVFDKNQDGVVNNGSELFGPNSGNGFMELAAYDTDGNNWIDENDEIYNKLQIWTKDAGGQDQLLAIGQAGIGAIYLGSVKSAFTLKGESNQTLGQIQQTGIFLREDGTAGTVQHVDISV